jgi:3-deoxy-D-manno-octulosonic-acid transferase
MREFIGLTLYRILLPVFFLAAFPGWVIKMLRRGGWGSGLRTRLGCYWGRGPAEVSGAVHFHAISVGEALLALKLIREWRRRDPGLAVVLATGTATGHAVAREAAAGIEGLEVTYSPLDFPWMVRAYLRRYQPQRVVLVEGEIWPHMLRACQRVGIPVGLANARLSPRSAARYLRFAEWVRPFFSLLDAVAVQDPADVAVWRALGVAEKRILRTGSVKFDPGSGPAPQKRGEFAEMLAALAPGAPLVLVASSHAGEEEWIATALRPILDAAVLALVPRHAERRAEVRAALRKAGFEVALRSEWRREAGFPAPQGARPVLVIDSTGELRDWTAHADVVVIGKSFLAHGGQNPCEAILAGKPVVHGPHMENFEPLASRLRTAGATMQVADAGELAAAVAGLLEQGAAEPRTRRAAELLQEHAGATLRTIDWLCAERPPAGGDSGGN